MDERKISPGGDPEQKKMYFVGSICHSQRRLITAAKAFDPILIGAYLHVFLYFEDIKV